mmetsp:Transcript_30521/g.87511  ORF Transcript_30521/g.87511 Transcript_30521/m.87511 type:complete len:264 (+) Transcript_30521:386-1177(+)
MASAPKRRRMPEHQSKVRWQPTAQLHGRSAFRCCRRRCTSGLGGQQQRTLPEPWPSQVRAAMCRARGRTPPMSSSTLCRQSRRTRRACCRMPQRSRPPDATTSPATSPTARPWGRTARRHPDVGHRRSGRQRRAAPRAPPPRQTRAGHSSGELASTRQLPGRSNRPSSRTWNRRSLRKQTRCQGPLRLSLQMAEHRLQPYRCCERHRGVHASSASPSMPRCSAPDRAPTARCPGSRARPRREGAGCGPARSAGGAPAPATSLW